MQVERQWQNEGNTPFAEAAGRPSAAPQAPPLEEIVKKLRDASAMLNTGQDEVASLPKNLSKL